MRVEYHGKAEVQFTKNGDPVGGPQEAPPGANDFIVIWDPRTGEIKEFIWTKNGSAKWSKDGWFKEINVPKGANDLEWSLLYVSQMQNSF